MGDEQLAGDVAGTHAELSELHDPPSHTLRQGAPVDEDATQLVDARLTWWGEKPNYCFLSLLQTRLT